MTFAAMLDATQDPLSLSAVGALLAALGLSTTAGLRAYLPLLAIAIADKADPGVLPLQPGFTGFDNPLVIIILVALVIFEFTIDKVPVLDHVSDAVHTLIRPLSGALIMAGTQNSLSNLNPWVAAGVGALLALALHGAKAATRPAVTATTVGHGNPVVSVGEDVLSFASVLLLIFAPVIGFVFLVIVLLLIWRGLRGLRQRFIARKPRVAASVAPPPPTMTTTTATTATTSGGNGRIGGLIGRAATRRHAAQAMTAPVPVPVPAPATPTTPAIPATSAQAAPPMSAPASPAPTNGTGNGTGNTTTVAATQQAQYAPPGANVAFNPIQPVPLPMPQGPDTTQTMPRQWPEPSQPGLYPGDAPTLPGSGTDDE